MSDGSAMTDPTFSLLALGYGYSARHGIAALGLAPSAVAVTARAPDKAERLAAAGFHVVPLFEADADARLAAAASRAARVLASAAPAEGPDPFLDRIASGLAASAAAGRLAWIGYLSTVGVYGDAGGGLVDETTPPAPTSERTRARVAAEAGWTALGRSLGVPVALLRLGGIYGPGRNPFVALDRGTARRVVKPGQMFNRIRVEDIGRAIAAAAETRFDGVLNVVDDEPTPPEVPLVFAAALKGMEPPPEVAFAEIEPTLSPLARSFWGESKRVGNARLHALLGDLSWPTHREGLAGLWRDGDWAGSAEDREDASPKFRRS
jgi:nucleoside-diphosphate-sugar epimerase